MDATEDDWGAVVCFEAVPQFLSVVYPVFCPSNKCVCGKSGPPRLSSPRLRFVQVGIYSIHDSLECVIAPNATTPCVSAAGSPFCFQNDFVFELVDGRLKFQGYVIHG